MVVYIPLRKMAHIDPVFRDVGAFSFSIRFLSEWISVIDWPLEGDVV